MTAPPTSTSGRSDTSLASSYEELRSRALKGSANDRPGALLLREGMVAWMAQRSACPDPLNPVAEVPRRLAEPLVSDEMNASIVRVLASMAMGSREEMSA